MVPEQDDLLGAAASRGDHTAQAYRAVADDGSRSTGRNSGCKRRMVAGGHHVRKGQQ